jgi:hypothetical protein
MFSSKCNHQNIDLKILSNNLEVFQHSNVIKYAI